MTGDSRHTSIKSVHSCRAQLSPHHFRAKREIAYRLLTKVGSSQSVLRSHPFNFKSSPPLHTVFVSQQSNDVIQGSKSCACQVLVGFKVDSPVKCVREPLESEAMIDAGLSDNTPLVGERRRGEGRDVLGCRRASS